jgi:YrbI family 3-deoxy-D-manno-octulosonate 8-phosphate phosphatase
LDALNLDIIKIVVSDIDGVLTDGRIIIDSKGNEQKRLCFRDIDAIGIGRKNGLDFILVTGEDNALAAFIAKRFSIGGIIMGAKDKLAALESICEKYEISPEHICYIGDGNRDADAIRQSGFGVAPADASRQARESAKFITDSKGGDGVLAEVVEKIVDFRCKAKYEY